MNIKIAIDGPAGSGKTTTAKLVAKKLGLTPIDTGAMYRAVALMCIREGIDIHNESEVVRIANEVNVDQKFEDDELKTFLNGENVTEKIRTKDVSRIVSIIAKYKGVRKRLVKLQREMAKRGGVVIEGRDIGLVVIPDADVKVFMKANLEQRAKRRLKELKDKHINISFDEVLKELSKRDAIDSNREHSPLKIPEDAIIIDTTNTTVEEQVSIIIKEVQNKNIT